MTKLKKLRQRLTNAYLVRCRNWGMCGQKSCEHYEPHRTAPYCAKNPYQYCECMKAFVHDIPIEETDDGDCDPNLAFKAKRESGEKAPPGALLEESEIDWHGKSLSSEQEAYYTEVNHRTVQNYGEFRNRKWGDD
jgi:hypothetical protein